MCAATARRKGVWCSSGARRASSEARWRAAGVEAAPGDEAGRSENGSGAVVPDASCTGVEDEQPMVIYVELEFETELTGQSARRDGRCAMTQGMCNDALIQ